MNINSHSERNRGFTIIELMVVIAIILILAAMLLPALGRAKDQAHKITCISDLKQLDYSAQMFADDNEDQLPPRRQTPNHWVERLKEYYVAEKIVQCPKGRGSEFTPHSYLLNGFNDYFELTLQPNEYDLYLQWLWPYGMRMSAIPEPSETILFGEKKPSSGHVHMDFSQGAGNDLEQVDHARHGAGPKGAGGSNFAFIDGSVRYVKYGGTLKPMNLWALVEEWRQQPLDPEP